MFSSLGCLALSSRRTSPSRSSRAPQARRRSTIHPSTALGRIEVLFGGHLPSPTELLGVTRDSLRQAGLSWRKVVTLRDVAERFSDGRLDPGALSNLPDDEVIAELTAVPGIGPWTAQGALVLALRRQDVVLPGDLALRKAVRRAYELDHLPSQAEMLAIAEKWRPYRSVATSYLFSAGLSAA